MNKTLTVVIPVHSDEDELINTLNSLPWTSSMEVILYSDDTEKTYDLLNKRKNEYIEFEDEDQPRFLISDLSGSENLKKKVAIEDCDSDYITFLRPGTEITKFSYEPILQESYDVRFGSMYMNSDEDEVSILGKSCSSYTLPESDEGIIFSVKYLRRNNIYPDINSDTNVYFLSKLYEVAFADIIEDWSNREFNLDLSEDYIIMPSQESLTLTGQTKIIKDCLEYWKNFNGTKNDDVLFRHFIWGKIQRAAYYICTGTSGRLISDYSKYLNPDNIDIVLI